MTSHDTAVTPEILRVAQLMEDPSMRFVFGSNEAGRHGRGAARTAAQLYGAVYGIGYGPMGRSFAVPTKDAGLHELPLQRIQQHVNRFLHYARTHPDLQFAVTRIGCGLAGFRDEDIAPLFEHAPENCHLPPGWRITRREAGDVG
jgi:hypothetical protein